MKTKKANASVAGRRFTIIVFSIAFVLLTVIQGGFRSEVYALYGLTVSILLLFQKKSTPDITSCSLLLFLCIAYYLSYFIHKQPISGVSNAMLPAVVLISVLFISSLSSDERIIVSRAIIIAAIIVACIGLLAYSDVIYINATVTNRYGRLASTIQYANGTGILFVVALILQNNDKKPYKIFRPLLLCALLLTLSFGSFLVYGICCITYAIMQNRGVGIFAEIVDAVAECIPAAIFAAMFYLMRNVLELPLLCIAVIVLLCCACVYISKHNKNKLSLKARTVCAGTAGIAALTGLLCLRGTEAVATLSERFVLMRDGMSAILKNIAFGIGVDGWATQYTTYQSTHSYDVRIIHNSYVQVGADAGLLAMLALIALAVYIVIKMLKKHEKSSSFVALCALLLHAIIDFTFRFAALNVCGVILYSCCDSPSDKKRFVISTAVLHILALAFAAQFLLAILL